MPLCGRFEWLCAGAFKLRGLLMAPLVVFMFVHYDERRERSVSEWTVGVALFSLGVALRVVAQRHLRYRLNDTQRLTQGGPYRHVRNPVYLGNVLILTGLALTSELPWLVPIAVGWAGLIYHLAVLFEGHCLLLLLVPVTKEIIEHYWLALLA
jgi:protein-S-isoprenylcysteine O-methyltransferase Ste14